MISIIRAQTDKRSMRLWFHHICYLRVSEESLADLVDEFVKDEISVVLIVWCAVIVNQELPVFIMFFKWFEIFFLSILNAYVEYLSIYSISKCCWNSSLCILDQKWLIIIWEQFLSKKYSIINELLFIVNSNLSKSDV